MTMRLTLWKPAVLLALTLLLACPAALSAQEPAAEEAPAALSAQEPAAEEAPAALSAQEPAAEEAPAAAAEIGPGGGGSADGLAAGRPTAPAFGRDIAKAAGAFVGVMALLYFTLKGVSRLGRRGLKGGRGAFRLRGALALDNRKYLAAVEIDGRLLVVGVGAESVTSLAVWPLDEESEKFSLALGRAAAPPAPEGPPDINIAELNRKSRL